MVAIQEFRLYHCLSLASAFGSNRMRSHVCRNICMDRTMRGATESTRPRLLQRHKTNPTLCVGPRSALRLLFWTHNMFGRCNPTRSPYPTINMRYRHRSNLPDCSRSVVFDLVRCSLQSSKRTTTYLTYRSMSSHVSDTGRHHSIPSSGKSRLIRFCLINHLSIQNNRLTFMSFREDTSLDSIRDSSSS